VALELLAGEQLVGRPTRVLDVGCGQGRVIELLEAAGYRVLGLDLASVALGAARQRLGPTARLVQGDAFQLGLADGAFDVVISLGYASVGSYPGVQAELARVLRPDGVALVDLRHVGLYHLPLLPRFGRRWLKAWRRGEALLPLLGFRPAPTWAAAGFRLEAVRLFNTHPPLGSWLPAEAYLTFERRIGRHLAPVLARTGLAKLRRVDPEALVSRTARIGPGVG
jgi:SAM-dependent methyltransferase